MTVASRPHAIELATGAFLDLNDPRPEDVTLEAIAAHLSKLCRFTGACRRFYSVAEHAVLVAARLAAEGHDARTQLCGLHHDDHEAFTGDVVRPLKSLLAGYDPIALRVQDAVERSLGLPSAFDLNVHRDVHEADVWALAAEAFHLLPSQGREWFCWGLYEPDGTVGALGLAPDAAERLWLERHHTLAARLDEPPTPLRPTLRLALEVTGRRFPRCRCPLHPRLTDEDLRALGAGCTAPSHCCPRLDAVRRRVRA